MPQYSCVKRYDQDTATIKQRAQSCKRSKDGKYKNFQLCTEECYIKDKPPAPSSGSKKKSAASSSKKNGMSNAQKAAGIAAGIGLAVKAAHAGYKYFQNRKKKKGMKGKKKK